MKDKMNLTFTYAVSIVGMRRTPVRSGKSGPDRTVRSAPDLFEIFRTGHRTENEMKW